MRAIIREAQHTDISAMVMLSEQKRIQYQEHQPLFWRKAEASSEKQLAFFEHLSSRDNVLMLVHETERKIDGFVIATLVKAPPVYDPQGLVCTIDDYCVADENSWHDTGLLLMNEVKRLAKQRGAVLVVVVCGHHDTPKKNMLLSTGYTIASEWFVQEF